MTAPLLIPKGERTEVRCNTPVCSQKLLTVMERDTVISKGGFDLRCPRCGEHYWIGPKETKAA